MPLIMIARLAFSPMMIGNTKVAPNMATTCWAPRPVVLPQDRRSSGATAAPGGGVLPPYTTFHPNDMQASCTYAPVLADRRSLWPTRASLPSLCTRAVVTCIMWASKHVPNRRRVHCGMLLTDVAHGHDPQGERQVQPQVRV